MNLYRFKTFRTTYYFPSIVGSQRILYGLYTPYGLMARIYWWLFRHLSIVRFLNKVDSESLKFPYERIISIMPKESILSFNMGTPGDEQKISMLGIEQNGQRFFSKYSEKPDAVALSRHEIDVLNALKDAKVAPELLDYKIEERFCFFRTSYVEGKSVSALRLNQEIVNMAISISRIHIGVSGEALLTGLSHGDFAPWNMLNDNGTYRLIDWEMAEERPLGYDLFTFIYKVNRWIKNRGNFKKSVLENDRLLNSYFSVWDIDDYKPYYQYFVNNNHD